MRVTFRTFTLLTAAALALTGCGGSDEEASDDRAKTVTAPTSSAPAEPAKSGGKALTQAEVEAALLTVPELPTGYTLSADQSDDDDTTTEGTTPECTAKLQALDGAGDESEKQRIGHAQRQFEGGGLATLLEEEISSYEKLEGVETRLDEVADVLSQCPTFTSTSKTDGSKAEFTVAPLSFPKLGDQTLALALTGKTEDINLKLNLVFVQVGNNVVITDQGGLTTDPAALEQATRTAVEKVAAAAAK